MNAPMVLPPAELTRATRALLAGNFAVGCGMMVVPGSLNDLSASLQVPVAVAGQLVSLGGLGLAIGAPVLAGALGRFDRRWLLTLTLVWYAVGLLLGALMPSFAALLPVRVLGLLAAAVFTPQAGAAVSVMAPPGERARAITFIFLGWSLASVLGMPLASLVGETLGWRWAFVGAAALSAWAAVWVWRTVPAGIRPPALTFGDWRAVLTHPLLMGLVAITVLSACGQFTLFSYMAPYYRQVLLASPGQVSALFLCFGVFGLLGNLLITRWVDRLGPASCVNVALASMALSLALWPLAASVPTMALVMLPWALGCFSSNSAQQARLSASAPVYAGALLALNSSAMYLGQAIGAATGGLSITAGGFAALPATALAWMAAALALSLGLAWWMRGGPHV